MGTVGPARLEKLPSTNDAMPESLIVPWTFVVRVQPQSVVATACAVKGTLTTRMPAANSHTLRLMGGIVSWPVSIVASTVLVVVMVVPYAKVCSAPNLIVP